MFFICKIRIIYEVDNFEQKMFSFFFYSLFAKILNYNLENLLIYKFYKFNVKKRYKTYKKKKYIFINYVCLTLYVKIFLSNLLVI